MTGSSEARAEILARVRAALGPAHRERVNVPRGYRAASQGPTQGPSESRREELLDLFVERVADYRATVTRCTDAEAASVIEAVIAAATAAALPAGAHAVLPEGLGWQVSGTVDPDGAGFTAAELDGFDAVVTGAEVGIAETGTIVLTHGAGQGRRALSLVPDVHVCVVRADQVVADVPDAVAVLDPDRPQTWTSGPSATSDIELNRVEGVHGPRTLHVVLVG